MAVLAIIAAQSVQSNSCSTDAIEERRKSLLLLNNARLQTRTLSPCQEQKWSIVGPVGIEPTTEGL